MKTSSEPWKVAAKMKDGTVAVEDDFGCIVASVQPAPYDHGVGNAGDHQDGNAALIARAPELRDMLGDLLGAVLSALTAGAITNNYHRKLLAELCQSATKILKEDEIAPKEHLYSVTFPCPNRAHRQE
ncbi:MAG: hypothetical protein ACYDHY_18935 [Acidiferrobacterales bacterium]